MIRILDTHTINKIAAGEVIERPFSVVKELVENAIDAGSTKITIEIKEGGVTFIRVTDNGAGIKGDEIETAFISHATSKISSLSDLNSLNTLGFRGEALASIAAVSQLEVTSKTKDAATAAYIEIFGGELIAKKELAANNGTIILMRNLFYNTPARKKFLKSTSAETAYISDFISKIALSRPDISIKYINNGNETLYTSGNGGLKTAILSIYGAEYSERLLSVDYAYEYYDVKLYGFIAKPEFFRSNRFYEDLFVNGRYIKDKTVSNAVEDAYKTYLPTGKFPAFVLNMKIGGDKIDVNAHPQKLEVRFKDERIIYDAVYDAVINALKTGALTYNGIFETKETKEEKVAKLQADSVYKNAPAEVKCLVHEKEPIIPEVHTVIKLESNPPILTKNAENTDGAPAKKEALAGLKTDLDETDSIEKRIFDKIELSKVKQQTLSERDDTLKNYRIVGKIFSVYWIIEQDNKMYIIDQHAAHERILFERLAYGEKYASISQRLLFAEKLYLSNSEQTFLTENIAVFENMGFEFSYNEQYSLTSVPSLYGTLFNRAMFMEILNLYMENRKQENNMEQLASIACRAALKANDKLAENEVKAIIDSLLKLKNPFTCPHGRPTIIEMTKYELEKRFKRV